MMLLVWFKGLIAILLLAGYWWFFNWLWKVVFGKSIYGGDDANIVAVVFFPVLIPTAIIVVPYFMGELVNILLNNH